MMDFSQGAGQSSGSDTIPAGQLAWAYLEVRALKPSQSGGQYIDCELTIDEGQPFARRKIFEKIGDPQHPGNSENYRQMGLVAVTRILEAGRNAGPHNPAGYRINDYRELSGLRVAIKIGVEPGEGGYSDKNRVADFLTPNPASGSGHKGFVALQAGEFDKFVKKGPAPAASGGAQAGFGFGQPQGGAPAAQPGFGAASTAAPAAATQGSGSWGAPAGPTPPQQPVPAAGWGSAAPAAGQPTPQTGSATTTTVTAPSPSDPTAAPQWMQQANGG